MQQTLIIIIKKYLRCLLFWGGGLVLGGRDYLIFSPAVRPQLYSSFNVIVARPCPSPMDGSLAHDIHISSLVVKHPESKASFRLPLVYHEILCKCESVEFIRI